MNKEDLPIYENTVYIPLGQSKWALVDTDIALSLVAPKFRLWKSKNGKIFYCKRAIRFDGKIVTQFLHRYVLEYYKINAPYEIDHINGNGLDNRLCNLRAATNSQNAGNVGLSSMNTSGFRGVTLHKKRQKWQAQITMNGKNKYLGLFEYEDKESAARRYDRAAIEHFGIEFAFTNFPKSDYI